MYQFKYQRAVSIAGAAAVISATAAASSSMRFVRPPTAPATCNLTTPATDFIIAAISCFSIMVDSANGGYASKCYLPSGEFAGCPPNAARKQSCFAMARCGQPRRAVLFLSAYVRPLRRRRQLHLCSPKREQREVLLHRALYCAPRNNQDSFSASGRMPSLGPLHTLSDSPSPNASYVSRVSPDCCATNGDLPRTLFLYFSSATSLGDQLIFPGFLFDRRHSVCLRTCYNDSFCRQMRSVVSRILLTTFQHRNANTFSCEAKLQLSLGFCFNFFFRHGCQLFFQNRRILRRRIDWYPVRRGSSF